MSDPAAPQAPHHALQRYRARLRPWRIGYLVAIVAVLAAVGVWVGVSYSRGEIANTTLRTAAHPAPSHALQSPADTLTPAWQSKDATAIGTPYWGGTVITYSQHTVSGRDAETGAATWSYTRANRDLCQVAQLKGVTIAVFRHKGNCDELTALDSGTGARKWTRTLDKDSAELNGTPRYSFTDFTLMLTTPGVIYAVDPVSGLDRWVFDQPGCTIRGAVLGSAGALISQDCAAPICKDREFCGSGPQLLLRDGTAGENKDSSTNKNNPDQIKWNLIGNTLQPASADTLISAVEPGGRTLTVLDSIKGETLSTLTLAEPAGDTVVARSAARAELLWTGGVAYAVQLTGADFFWTSHTAGPPTVTNPQPDQEPSIATELVAVAGSSERAGLALLDPGTGQVRQGFAVAPPAPGSLVFPFGSGFLVAGPNTQVYR